jgi:hypothetical protein
MCPALITPRTEKSTKASTRGRLSFLDVSGWPHRVGKSRCVLSGTGKISFLGQFRTTVLNKIDALLTRQSFDFGPVARIFLKSRCTASIRIIHAEQRSAQC